MKKMLCIFFAFLLPTVTLVSHIPVISDYAKTVSAEDFVRKIGDMVHETDDDNLNYGASSVFEDTYRYSEYQSRRLIVKSKYKIDTSMAESYVNGYNDLWILSYETAEKTAQAHEYYKSLKAIEYVEPDRPLYALDVDESVTLTEKEYMTWGPEYIGIDTLNNDILLSGIELKETVVAVLDTGTDETHPDFKGRVIPTGVNTSLSGDVNSSSDDNGHGTQVAGVVIDSTLDNVIVKPYKVLDKWGQGTVITLAAGIICAVNDGVDIINMSISLSENSETLREAILLADRNDILLVAASGNDSSDTAYYPASYDCVIKVGATNEAGTIANFSTRGNDVDFAAPGVGIYTTNIGGTYKTVNGTSFSSPLVAGLAATILSYEPDLSSEDIREILIENAVYIQETDSKIKYGNGIIRAPEFYTLSHNHEKTLAPYFSHGTAIFREKIELEIFCDSPDSIIY